MSTLLILQMVALLICGALARALPLMEPSYNGSDSCIIPPLSDIDIQAFLAGGADTVQLGGSSLFQYVDKGGPQKWTDSIYKDVSLIAFCYRTASDRVENVDRVQQAIQLWTDALGGERSKMTGHSIYFMEWYDFRDHKPHYCQDSSSDIWTWNRNLPFETVAISTLIERGGGASATLGRAAVKDQGKPWKNAMWIGPTASAAIIAHEWGHVMGMDHEHQRADRDRFVHYSCENIKNYDEALRRARHDDPMFWPRALCVYSDIAKRYGFGGNNYDKSITYNEKSLWTLHAETEYDVYSIMHYSSTMYGKPACVQGDLTQCPLAKWKMPGDRNGGMEKIPKWTKPSPLDAQWVRSVYPYKGHQTAACPADEADDEEKSAIEGGAEGKKDTVEKDHTEGEVDEDRRIDEGNPFGYSRKLLLEIDRAREEYVKNQVYVD